MNLKCSSLSPDKRLLSVVGDDLESLIVSADSGKTIFTLSSHTDFSFSTSWSPDGNYLTTGSQDHTLSIYDVRNFKVPLIQLASNIASVQSSRFNSSGSILVLAEMVDYVHIIDMKQSFSSDVDVSCQTLDFFGEISGISLSPCDTFLFVGVDERTFGAIVEFQLDLRLFQDIF